MIISTSYRQKKYHYGNILKNVTIVVLLASMSGVETQVQEDMNVSLF
jgi:hypothetical protein